VAAKPVTQDRKTGTIGNWHMTNTISTQASGTSTAYAWYVAALLTLTQIVSYLDRFLPSLVLQPIKHALALSDFQIGLLLGPAFVIFYVTLGVPLGWLADRVSRRAILAVGIAIWCTMTAAGAVAKTFPPLLLTRLGVGLGEATVAPTSISLISDYFTRERRSRAISLFMSGAFLGAGTTFLFFGPLVHHIESLPSFSLPLIGHLEPWRMCFVLVGLPGLLLAVLMLTVREPRRLERTASASFQAAFAFIGQRWRAFGTLFLASACNLTMGALAFWNVALFKRTWNWDVAQVGVAVGLILFTAGPAGTFLGIFLTNRDLRLGRRDATLRALFLGLLIGVPTYILFPLMPSAALGLAALFFAHLGQAMATAAGPATLVMLTPGQMRAQATAVYYLVISVVAQLIGPPLVGIMTDKMGDPTALRYAISIEVAMIGIPSIILVSLGFAAYRRSVLTLEQELGAPTPAAVGAHA
jgi:MFS family permease